MPLVQPFRPDFVKICQVVLHNSANEKTDRQTGKLTPMKV